MPDKTIHLNRAQKAECNILVSSVYTRKFFINPTQWDDSIACHLHQDLSLWVQVAKGLVVYHSMPEVLGVQQPQLHIYNTCLEQYRGRHTWMSFTDADEFFVLRNKSLSSLIPLLQQYEQYGALAVNWQVSQSQRHKLGSS